MNYNIKIKFKISLITFGLIAILHLIGCDQESGITTPLSDTSYKTLVPALPEDVINDERARYPNEEVDIYSPGADSIFIMSNILPPGIPDMMLSKFIDGINGGNLEIENNFIIEDYTINIRARLIIPSGAFIGTIEISMEIDNTIGTISFYPHMIFNEPVELDLQYTGIDVSGIDPRSMDFIFQYYNGSREQTSYKKIKVNRVAKEIHLEKAQLNHFSRYGFVNKQF